MRRLTLHAGNNSLDRQIAFSYERKSQKKIQTSVKRPIYYCLAEFFDRLVLGQ